MRMPKSPARVLLFLLLAAPGGLVRAEDAHSPLPEVVAPTRTLYVPTSASIHGAAGTFFHTDLWASNRSYTSSLSVTATISCFAGTCAGQSTSQSLTLGPRETKLYGDVVASLFGLSGAGSIVLAYQSATEDLAVTTRTYTPSLPSPTNGTAIPALAIADARARALFLGLGNHGGDLSSGFRSNAGVFNPWPYPVHVTFALASATGLVLGTTSADIPSTSAVQISDVFLAAGSGTLTTTNANLIVTSGWPVFHFVTVIDNQSGDSVFVPAADDVPAAPTTSLLANGTFDANVAGWTTVGVALAWSPTDADGNPASGSAVITNTAAIASYGGAWISQCVAVQPGSVLTLGGKSFISSAQATTGGAQLQVYFFSGTNCSGGSLGYVWTPDGDEAWTPDRWNSMSGTGPVPAGAQSASVEVQFTKREAGGTLTGYIDRLSVVASPR
jgi:hypothetical protein